MRLHGRTNINYRCEMGVVLQCVRITPNEGDLAGLLDCHGGGGGRGNEMAHAL